MLWCQLSDYHPNSSTAPMPALTLPTQLTSYFTDFTVSSHGHDATTTNPS